MINKISEVQKEIVKYEITHKPTLLVPLFLDSDLKVIVTPLTAFIC